MCSKLIRAFVGVGLMLGLSSCLPIGDKPAETPKTETKIGQEAKCLTGLMPTLEAFVNGEAETARVTALWTCFDGALGLFERRVRGDDPKAYTAREIAGFFEDNFLDADVKINDRLLTEVMRFKQLVVGGENARMTRPELARLREFARFMRGLSEELNPQMKILALKWQVTGNDKFSEDFEKFEAAKTVSLKVIEQVAAWIEPHQQSYRIENFVVFLKELQGLAGKEWKATAEIERLIPLLSRLKGALTGTEESVIAPGDWRRFGRLGVRAYLQYLRYYYFFQQNPHRAEDPELLLVVRSLDDLFGVVADVLQEKTGQRLVRDEIISVLDAVSDAFPEFKVSDHLVDELLKLKTVFLGGAENELTPADLGRARLKLDPLRRIANLFLAHARIFELKWDPTGLAPADARSQFDAAETALVEMGKVAGPIFEADYDLNSLLKLVRAFEETAPEAAASAAAKLETLLPALIVGKNAILADTGPVIRKDDFPFLMDVVARAGARAYEYNYFVAGRNLLREPAAIAQLIEPLPDVMESLFRARGRGEPRIFTEADLRALIKGLDDGKYLKGLYSRANLEMLVPILMKHILPPPADRLTGQTEGGFGPRAVENLYGEAALWAEVQQRLNDLRAATPLMTHAEFVAAVKKSGGAGNDELLRLIDSTMPLAFDPEGRLVITTRAEVPYSELSLDTLNFVRGGLRLVIRGWGSNLTQTSGLTGLDQAQFTAIWTAVRPIGIEMEWIAPDNFTFDTSRFREGNLFTGFANGNDFLDFGEAGHLASMIVSGLNIHQMLKTRMMAECQVAGAAVPSVHAECALEILRAEAPRVLASMPGMVQLLKGDKKQVGDFLLQMLKAAGWEANDELIAPISDLALVPHVLQYIESIFRRWDGDGDGFLNRDEAMNAEPVFRPLIQKVSNLTEANWLRAVFAYILVKGKPPETFWEKFQFQGWVDSDETWPIHADRVQLGKILGFIADSVRNKVVIQVRDEKDE